MILGLVEHEAGTPIDTSLEMLTLARDLAGDGEAVEVVTFGAEGASVADHLGEYGVEAVHHVTHDRLEAYAPDAWAESIAGIVEDAEPDAVEAASGAADAQPSPVDPEALLFEMDAVEESADGEEIVLTDPFADELLAAAEDLRDDETARAAAVASILGVDVDDATIHQEVHGPALYADSERIHRWPSEAALLADAGVHDALSGREGWVGTNPQQRLGICRALRSFLTTCPVCGGDVGLTEETVESCCRAWAVFAVRCDDCEAHFLELEPEEADQPSETVVEESEGARGVSGGFTR
jgi:hypothetical protein